MKFLLSFVALAATCTGLAQGTSEAILSYTNSISGFVSGTVGWTFQPTNAFAVMKLGCFAKVFEDNPGVSSVQVGLWNDGGLLLASNSITPGSALFDQTRYEPVNPVSLGPGQIYHVGICCSGGSFGIDTAAPSTGGSVSAASAIQLDGIAIAASGFSFPPAVSGTAGSIFAGPNFRFQSVPTLSIQRWTGDQVRISWFTVFPGYTLQSEFGLSGGWGNAGLTVTTVGNENVAFDTIGPTPKSYRLVK
jgi:hypothetical protein